MSLPTHRPYTRWALWRPQDPSNPARGWSEPASVEVILEEIRAQAEIRAVGREVFSGTLGQKNKLWIEYRNFLRQASSNYEASRAVPNRSAGLLQYYSLLNFAKAELLVANSTAIIGKRIGHGLSFNPTRAKTVAGDSLTVQDGVFPLLYEARTGVPIPIRTKLPVKALLQQIPEIGTQLNAVGIVPNDHPGLLQLIASDSTASWPLLAIEGSLAALSAPVQKILLSRFNEVATPPEYRDHFGLSRRWSYPIFFLESKTTLPHLPSGGLDSAGAMAVTWALKDILETRETDPWDARIAPGLYKSKMFVLPPSVARYAVAFYTSSLVRYRPAMFDSQIFPDQAFLFDAVTREISLNILIDTFAGLTGRDQHFRARDDFRV